MTLLGIGIDIVETARIRTSMDRFGDRFLHRVFGPEELRYATSMKRPELHLAARFAAKEAISKAFGTGIGAELGWRDMEIVREPSGAPRVRLSPKAQALAERLGGTAVWISLSHTDHYAAAQAALVAAPDQGRTATS